MKKDKLIMIEKGDKEILIRLLHDFGPMTVPQALKCTQWDHERLLVTAKALRAEKMIETCGHDLKQIRLIEEGQAQTSGSE